MPGSLPTIGLGNNQIAPSQSTFASPLGSIQFTAAIFADWPETATHAIVLSRLDQRLLTTYGHPHFLGSEWSSLSSFSLERTEQKIRFLPRASAIFRFRLSAC